MEHVLYTFHFNWLDCIWWLVPLTLSTVFVIASIGIWRSRRPSFAGHIARVIIPIIALFCCIVTIVWIGLSVFSYHAIKAQITAEKYREVRGPVENFSPMPWSGHQQETFDISGISFSYSTFAIEPGYHTASSWGGVITHDGQYLTIQYIGTDEYKIITYIAETAK